MCFKGGHDEVRIIAAEIVDENWDIKGHAAAPVAHIVGRSEIIAGDVVVIPDFTQVRIAVNERTLDQVANVAHCRSVMSRLFCPIEWVASVRSL